MKREDHYRIYGCGHIGGYNITSVWHKVNGWSPISEWLCAACQVKYEVPYVEQLRNAKEQLRSDQYP